MTRTSDLTLPVALAAGIPTLVLRIGVVFLRMKAKRRRAVRAFRRALEGGGMGREAADRLCEEYASYGRLRTYLPRGMGLPSLPFKF